MARSTPVSRPPVIVRGAKNPTFNLHRGPSGTVGDGSRGGLETPRQKFERLMRLRGGSLREAFNNIRKLANKESYPHTQEDIEVLMSFLRTELDFTEESFKSGREVAGGIILPRRPDLDDT